MLIVLVLAFGFTFIQAGAPFIVASSSCRSLSVSRSLRRLSADTDAAELFSIA